MVAWHDATSNSYWVTNTLLQTLDEADMLAIADLDETRLTRLSEPAARSRRRRRRRLGRAGHGRLLRLAGPRGLGDGRRRGEGREPLRRRADDPRARPAGARRRALRAPPLHDLDGRAARQRAPALLLRRHAADLLRRRRPLARARRRRAALRRLRARAGDEEHRAVGDRRSRSAATCPRSPTSPARSSSRRAPPSTTSSTPTAS